MPGRGYKPARRRRPNNSGVGCTVGRAPLRPKDGARPCNQQVVCTTWKGAHSLPSRRVESHSLARLGRAVGTPRSELARSPAAETLDLRRSTREARSSRRQKRTTRPREGPDRTFGRGLRTIGGREARVSLPSQVGLRRFGSSRRRPGERVNVCLVDGWSPGSFDFGFGPLDRSLAKGELPVAAPLAPC